MLKTAIPHPTRSRRRCSYAFAKDILDRKGLTKDEFKKQMTKVTLSTKDSLIPNKGC